MIVVVSYNLTRQTLEEDEACSSSYWKRNPNWNDVYEKTEEQEHDEEAYGMMMKSMKCWKKLPSMNRFRGSYHHHRENEMGRGRMMLKKSPGGRIVPDRLKGG